eukprot:3798495-Prymnesium_polylepis.1
MTFKTKPNTYSLGLAPSSRAKCRACKGLVAKGEARVVTHAFVRPNRGTFFVRHVRCVSAAFVASMLKAHGSVDRVPTDSSMDAEALASIRAQLSTSTLSTHSS